MTRFAPFRRFRTLTSALALSGAMLAGPVVAAQYTAEPPASWGGASHVIMPQTRSFAIHNRHGRRAAVIIEKIDALVRIREQTAATTLDIRLVNTSNARHESILLLPIPGDAAVSDFMFEGPAAEPMVQILRADEARRVYDQIVAQMRDPALLEFAGYNLIRSSVFPVEPNGTQRIRLTYETILEGDGNRFDYLLPRSESLLATVPWNITVDVQATTPISMVYSPSHALKEDRQSARHVRLSTTAESATAPGAFRLSYLLERDGVTATLFAYPDPKVGGGYFLLLAGLPATVDAERQAIKREVTLVLDRSGSMAGRKMDQVRAAALQIVEALGEGEHFNIIDYATRAERFAERPVARTAANVLKAREYLESLRPIGGTNIHDALVEALRQPPTAGTLPIVLFLTDGLPTVGQTSEVRIRELVEQHNEHRRRVFTFGVGTDVNVPLLDRLADVSRARTTYILPDEDVEVKVGQVFRRLYGPVLSDLSLTTRGKDGQPSTALLRELIPGALPDVFEGDQIVLLGQYRENQPVTFELAGNFLGRQRTFTFSFNFDEATTKNAFVPRLWAARRIAWLVDEIRQAGAATPGTPLSSNTAILSDARYKELIDEIVRLSTEFGILSEYTAFLATEGANLGDWENLVEACRFELDTKAIRTRSGLAAVSQGQNLIEGKQQLQLKADNRYWNAQMESVTITTCQQMNDKAFFKRGQTWVDAQIVASRGAIEPQRTVEFGSDEHFDIVRDLIAQNRQGCASLDGDILLHHNGQIVLIRRTDN